MWTTDMFILAGAVFSLAASIFGFGLYKGRKKSDSSSPEGIDVARAVELLTTQAEATLDIVDDEAEEKHEKIETVHEEAQVAESPADLVADLLRKRSR